jgi:uncharacterized membrane protein
MEVFVFFSFVSLVLLVLPLGLAIRTFIRLGRQQRAIHELELEVARLSALVSSRLSTEAPEARPERVAQPRVVPGTPPVPGEREARHDSPMPPAAVAAAAAATRVDAREPGTPPSLQAPAHHGSVHRVERADAGIPHDTRDEPESLETTIGTRWLLYVGIAAIVIGAAYFEKLAIEKGWIGETARVIQGGVIGLALVYIGTRFVRAGYSLYGQMICGGGAAILYVSTYAAFNFYHLIDRPVAFVLLVAITAMTAWLADRQQSQGLAVLAVGGGFGTPFLLPSGTDAQIALFGYDAILVAGTMYLAHRRDWPLLNIVSYVFTMLTIAAWAERFYTQEKYLRTELFLTLFCGMFLFILRECRRSQTGGGQLAAIFLWTAPAAYYFASLVVLAYHETALLIWLVALMLAGGFASVAIGTLAGFVTWMAATAPLLLWTVQHPGDEWLAPGLAATAGIYAVALAAQLRAMLERDEFSPVAVIWLHLNGLLMFAGAYFLIEPVHVAVTGAAAAGFAVWNGALAALLFGRRRDYALHFTALAFTLLSIAIALQFDGPAVTVGWAAEGAVIVALGLHERRDWLRLGGIVLSAIAVSRTLELLFDVAPINQAVLLNPRALSAAFVMGLAYVLAWLHHRDADAPDRTVGIAAALIVAQVLGLALLTSEINAYWRGHQDHFAQELMISVTWALYSTVLIVVGLKRRYAPIRYFAMMAFAVTTAKVFFVDLAELERIYRVMSVIALGILLLFTSWLYQRTRDAAPLGEGIDDLNGRI